MKLSIGLENLKGVVSDDLSLQLRSTKIIGWLYPGGEICVTGCHVTSRNQGLYSNDQGRQRRETLGTRLVLRFAPAPGWPNRCAIACEQAHLYQEPAKRGKVWVKRGKVTLPRPILLASSRSRLPVLTSEPARRLGAQLRCNLPWRHSHKTRYDCVMIYISLAYPWRFALDQRFHSCSLERVNGLQTKMADESL